MDIRMVAAARGVWIIMAIHREGMEVTGMEIMEGMGGITGMEKEEGIIKRIVFNGNRQPGRIPGLFSCKPIC